VTLADGIELVQTPEHVLMVLGLSKDPSGKIRERVPCHTFSDELTGT
jgi:hypothetical protein